MGSLRVVHDWATSLSRIGERNGSPLQCSCLENPRDVGAWLAAVYGVAHDWSDLAGLSLILNNFRIYCQNRTQFINQLIINRRIKRDSNWKRFECYFLSFHKWEIEAQRNLVIVFKDLWMGNWGSGKLSDGFKTSNPISWLPYQSLKFFALLKDYMYLLSHVKGIHHSYLVTFPPKFKEKTFSILITFFSPPFHLPCLNQSPTQIKVLWLAPVMYMWGAGSKC